MTEPINTERLEALAASLFEAERSRVAITRPSDELPWLTLDHAYRVQQLGLERRLALGERVVGRKVGLTSLAMQQQLGVDSPDFGIITDRMVIDSGGELAVETLLAPRLEPEFAFRINHELPPSPTLEEMRQAIDAVAIAIEVIDSRIEHWNVGLVDTVADNASSARIVVGEWREADPPLIDALPDLEITLRANDIEVCRGPGSAVLGDPVQALHWLATAIGRYGQRFAKGQVVLAGAVTRAEVLSPGTSWSVTAPGFATATLITT